MAGRAIANTTLEFGVVSVPVALRKVSENGDLALDTASPDDNARVQRYVDSVTGADCTDNAICKKGVFMSKPDKDDRSTWHDFREIPKETLAEIKEETKIETIEILGFLPQSEVPFERALGCYYLAPQKGQTSAAKPLKLLREALAETGKAGVLKLVLKDRQRPAVVYAKDGGLYVNTMVWAEDFKEAAQAAEVLEAVAQPEAKMVALAVDLVDGMSVDRAVLDGLSDDYRPKLLSLYEAALAGEEIAVTEKVEKEKVETDNLEALLQASIKQAKPKGKGKPKKAAVAA